MRLIIFIIDGLLVFLRGKYRKYDQYDVTKIYKYFVKVVFQSCSCDLIFRFFLLSNKARTNHISDTFNICTMYISEILLN